MKLNIVDAESEHMAMALGIPQDRYEELMQKISSFPPKGTMTGRAANIAEMCDTIEEYTLCIVQDIRWLIATDILPIELTNKAKAKFSKS